MRNKQGLLIYDDEFRRRFMSPKKIALNNAWVKKHSELIDAKDRGEISVQEYDRLVEELDDEHTAACEKLYDEEFGDNSANDEDFFSPPMFANA
ncbi:MAG: hypothetical protein IKP64_09105 [Selenomonadaceae bacterium]|nr:hypothetical protein [Selenomonadaceae bacterium]MBR4383700.1 hypothetical protein [Selenomonadaceae bacterium]